LQKWEAVFEDHRNDIAYIGWGEESCPDTKRLHYQGWVQFSRRMRFHTALKIMGGHVTMFQCKGTEEQNNKYCRKDNKFRSVGNFSTQGKRQDLAEIFRQFKNPDIAIMDIADAYPGDWLRYHRGLLLTRQYAVRGSTTEYRKVIVRVFSGGTGTGKTRRAVESGGFMIHGDSLQWWDGYEGEESIIIDEYSNQVPITKLLNLLDGYQLRLAVKGGFTYANWKKVIITTNLASLHDQAKIEHQEALARRITEWINFDELYGSDG